MAIWSSPTSPGGRSTWRPALVLAAQLMFGALFGFLGLLLADPIVATIKIALEDLSETTRRLQTKPAARAAGNRPTGPGCLAAPHRQRGIGRDLQDMDVEAQVLIGPDRAALRRVRAIGEAARDDDLVAAALLHLGQRLAEAGDDLHHQERRRAAAFGGVEHRAVFGPAGIFDDHPVHLADDRARCRRRPYRP